VEVWSPGCEFEVARAPRKAPRRRASRHFASASVTLSETVMPKGSGSFSAPPPKPKVGAPRRRPRLPCRGARPPVSLWAWLCEPRRP